MNFQNRCMIGKGKNASYFVRKKFLKSLTIKTLGKKVTKQYSKLTILFPLDVCNVSEKWSSKRKTKFWFHVVNWRIKSVETERGKNWRKTISYWTMLESIAKHLEVIIWESDDRTRKSLIGGTRRKIIHPVH